MPMHLQIRCAVVSVVGSRGTAYVAALKGGIWMGDTRFPDEQGCDGRRSGRGHRDLCVVAIPVERAIEADIHWSSGKVSLSVLPYTCCAIPPMPLGLATKAQKNKCAHCSNASGD